MILDFGYLCMAFKLNLPSKFNFPCHINTNDRNIRVGGAATNQAIAAARSGAKTALVGTVGNDVFGKTILDTLRREGINSSGIAKSDTQTGIIHEIINVENEKAIISSSGANLESVASQIPDNMLNERALVLLQTDVSKEINLDILKRTKSRNAKSLICISDAKNIDEEMLEYLDIIIIDESNIPLLCRSLPIQGDDLTQLINKDVYCVVARNNGCDGAYVINRNGDKYEISESTPPHKTNNTDTFDSFCGTFTACIQAGLNINKSTQYAVSASQLTARKNDFPYLDEIQGNIG